MQIGIGLGLKSGGRGAAAPAFSPLSLSPVFWLKADGTLWQESTRTTPAIADADPVGAWDDASGNARHFTQVTASKRTSLKLAIQNSKPVVRPDGTDDFLVSGSVAHGVGTGDFWLGGVIRTGAAAGTYKALWANGSFAPCLYLHSGKINFYWAGDKTFDTALSNSTAYLIEVWRDAGTVKAAVNGVQEATTFALATSMATGVQSLWTDNATGSSSGTNDLGEWLFCAGSGFLAQQAALRIYLKARWGTP